MEIKNYLVLVIAFTLVSCSSKKDEVSTSEKNTLKIKRQIMENSTAKASDNKDIGEILKEEENYQTNPLGKYITDDIHSEGEEIVYREKQHILAGDTFQFKGSEELQREEIEKMFNPTILLSQGGVNSAVIKYIKEGNESRAIISSRGKIEVGEETYYVEVYKDKVGIKKGENGLIIHLFLRER